MQLYMYMCMRNGLWETRPHWWPRACSLRVVVYKIQKYIANSAVWSLANLNNFVVGRTCRWLLGFYSSGEPEIEELLDGSLFRSDFAQASTLLMSFSRFWTSAIDIEVSKKEYICLPSFLCCFFLQKYIFESHYRIFAYIFLMSKTLLVLRWHHRPTRPILRYCSAMGRGNAKFRNFEKS